MNDLDDELDLRFHRGLKPDVYYRCPASETLDGALRNELHKNATSLIPVEIVTEFVFSANSTITIPVTQQGNLNPLGVIPGDVPQSLMVEYALCRGFEGKDRLLTQRAVARSLIDVIQAIDGFKYSERQALNKEGTDGTRFKYVCSDSLQNRDRSTNKKKKEGNAELDDDEKAAHMKKFKALQTFDCGGAIHIKFSTKRNAVNVVYKHNPIHRDVESRPVNGQNGNSQLPVIDVDADEADDIPKQKRKRRSKKEIEEAKAAKEANGNGYSDHLDMSTSPETSKSLQKKRKKSGVPLSGEAPPTKQKKSKQTKSPSKARSSKKDTAYEPAPEPAASRPIAGKACIRCREKKIKCNEAKPQCNQCRRGLWTCQYELEGTKKRSKNGCLNCRSRKRKCTEEKPSCAYCLRMDDDCQYAE